MFFSICIPQYGRYEHLKQQLVRLREQSCQDFEVCISDDISPERRWEEMRAWLRSSGMAHVYVVQEKNLRYDANLRAAIGLASGKYVLLMGNDDRLAETDTLARLKAELEAASLPEVAITNFKELSSGRTFRRVTADGQMVSGLDGALASFRNYSLVSGVLFLREPAQALANDHWDGSEMYQMAVGSRLVARGGRLLGIDRVCIEKDIQLPGESVESYANKTRQTATWSDWWHGRKSIPLVRFCSTEWDAIGDYCPADRRRPVAAGILKQMLTTTYPFWLIEYKRVFGWRTAVGLAFGMRPRFLLAGFPADAGLRGRMRMLYLITTLAALITPVTLFKWLEPRLHRRAKQATWKA